MQIENGHLSKIVLNEPPGEPSKTASTIFAITHTTAKLQQWSMQFGAFCVGSRLISKFYRGNSGRCAHLCVMAALLLGVGMASRAAVLPAQSNKRVCGSGVPDLHAAKKIPISEVIQALDLERDGSMIRCWRPDAHQHGDRTPSVGIHHQRNRIRCFVCDARSLSTVDLVGSVLGLDTFHALLWLDERFPLPRTRKGKHLPTRAHPIGRAAVSGNPLEPLIRCGLYSFLSESEIRILTVLTAFADPRPNSVAISYAALRRYSGIRRNETLARAIRRLENISAVHVHRGRGGDGLNTTNEYFITFEDERFLSLLRDCQETTRHEVDVERQVRKMRRLDLSHPKAVSTSKPASSGYTGIKPVSGSTVHDPNFPGRFNRTGNFHKVTEIAASNGKNGARPH